MKETLQKVPERYKESFVGRVIQAYNEHKNPDQAACLSYYLLFSFIPLLLAAVSILSLVGLATHMVHAVIPLLDANFPPQMAAIIKDPLLRFSQFGAAGITLVISVLSMGWSASQYLTAFGRALDTIQENEPSQPGILLRIRMFVPTLLMLVCVMIAGLCLTINEPVANFVSTQFPRFTAVLPVIEAARYPVFIVIYFAMLAILYLVTPSSFSIKRLFSRKECVSPRPAFFPGAIIATILLLITTFIFTTFVSRFGNYDAVYGALAGIIIALLWFWLVNSVLLLGAEINQKINIKRGVIPHSLPKTSGQ